MTKNKVVLLIIIFVIISLGYFFTANQGLDSGKNPSSQKLKPVASSTSSLEVLQKMRLENKQANDITSKPIEVITVNENEANAQMEFFDKKEEEWVNSVKNLIGNDKLFQFYLVYKEECEAQKNEVYEDFHKNLEAKHGKNYKYSMSEDQTNRENEINEIYLKKMQKMLGDEKYQAYLKLKDDFNEKLAREANGKKTINFEF